MDQQIKTYFFLEYGLDTELLISPPRVKYVERDDWVSDDFTDACMLCRCQFTFKNRRHHCRVCGLLFCNDCCPIQEEQDVERLCSLCYLNHRVDNFQVSPSLYTLDFLEEPLLRDLFDNHVVKSYYFDLLRLIGNSLRNQGARAQFFSLFSIERIQYIIELFSMSLKTTEDYFLANILLGLFINLTASTDVTFAKYLEDNLKLSVVLVTNLYYNLNFEINILIIHCLRNLSYYSTAAQQMADFDSIYYILYKTLYSGNLKAQELVLALLGNIIKLGDDKLIRKIITVGQAGDDDCPSVRLAVDVMFEKYSCAYIQAARFVSFIFIFLQDTTEVLGAVLDKYNIIGLFTRLITSTLENSDYMLGMCVLWCFFYILRRIDELGMTIDVYGSMYSNELRVMFDAVQQDIALLSRSAAGVVYYAARLNGPGIRNILADDGLRQFAKEVCDSAIQNEQYQDMTEHLRGFCEYTGITI